MNRYANPFTNPTFVAKTILSSTALVGVLLLDYFSNKNDVTPDVFPNTTVNQTVLVTNSSPSEHTFGDDLVDTIIPQLIP
jgi:hypothetical protein